MTGPEWLGDGPSLAELELMADVREIAGERDAALAEVAQLKATIRKLRAQIRAAATPVALAA
jgi:molybdopterin converting factor small subunit